MVARWYVYALTDPRDGEVFYVGKGRGRRIFDHVAEAARLRGPALRGNAHKIGRIHSILRDGLKPGLGISGPFEIEIEAEAFRAETELMIDIGMDQLTNIQRGRDWDGVAIAMVERLHAGRHAPALAEAIASIATGSPCERYTAPPDADALQVLFMGATDDRLPRAERAEAILMVVSYGGYDGPIEAAA